MYKFEISTPLGYSVRVTEKYWDIITTVKHPVMSGKENEVIEVLSDPDEIRMSIRDKNVHLYYKLIKNKRWICVVVKQSSGDGFVITAYPTDKIKEGVSIWKK